LERALAEVDGFVASLLLSTRGLSPGHYRVVASQLKDEPLSDLPSQAKELFGSDRLTRAFRDGGDRPGEHIDRLRAAVKAHLHGDAATDDQTLVAARVL
jgi:hypothetical protein